MKIGSTHTIAASTRVPARNGIDRTPIESSASISSEILIAPSCAVNPVPTFAASAIATTTGASSRVLAMADNIPERVVMPTSSSPRCVSTPSIIAAASDIANTIPMVPPPESTELVPKLTSLICANTCLRYRVAA